MTAALMICGQKMQVIARHGEGLHVFRRPEPNQRSHDIRNLKLRLNRCRWNYRHSFFSCAHRARSYVGEMSFHPQRKEEVIGMPKLIELGDQMTEVMTLRQDGR